MLFCGLYSSTCLHSVGNVNSALRSQRALASLLLRYVFQNKTALGAQHHLLEEVLTILRLAARLLVTV